MLFYVCVPIKKNLILHVCQKDLPFAISGRTGVYIKCGHGWLFNSVTRPTTGSTVAATALLKCLHLQQRTPRRRGFLNDFRAGRVSVVVATVAFGLGVSYFHNDYNSLRHFFSL